MVDIDDPSTWVEPPQALLDMGFNVWFQQAPTKSYPEAAGKPIYLGKVEGSLLCGAGKLLGILPTDAPQRRGAIYQLIGPWNVKDFFIFSLASEVLSPADNVLVEDTGRVSGLMMSGRGHYREVQVKPVNTAAVQLFGGNAPRFVPEYLLHPTRKQ